MGLERVLRCHIRGGLWKRIRVVSFSNCWTQKAVWWKGASAEDCLKSVYTAHSSAVITGMAGCGSIAWSEGRGSGGVGYPYITQPGQDLRQKHSCCCSPCIQFFFQVHTNLKGKFTQKWKFCHYLFTLMLFRTYIFRNIPLRYVPMRPLYAVCELLYISCNDKQTLFWRTSKLAKKFTQILFWQEWCN